LLQQDCTPATLAATLARLIGDDAVAAAQRVAFRAVLATLRPPKGLPSEAAAHAVLDVLAAPAPSRQA